MALGSQVINFIGLDFLDNACQIRAVRQIAVMQLEADIFFMRILVKMIHPLGVEQRGTPLDAMHFISLFQ